LEALRIFRPMSSLFVTFINYCLLFLCLCCILQFSLFSLVSSLNLCIYFSNFPSSSIYFQALLLTSNVVSLFVPFFSFFLSSLSFIFHFFLFSFSPFCCYRHLFSYVSVLIFIIFFYSKFYSSVASFLSICHDVLNFPLFITFSFCSKIMQSRILRRL
jgi:hypothetical protein